MYHHGCAVLVESPKRLTSRSGNYSCIPGCWQGMTLSKQHCKPGSVWCRTVYSRLKHSLQFRLCKRRRFAWEPSRHHFTHLVSHRPLLHAHDLPSPCSSRCPSRNPTTVSFQTLQRRRNCSRMPFLTGVLGSFVSSFLFLPTHRRLLCSGDLHLQPMFFVPITCSSCQGHVGANS